MLSILGLSAKAGAEVALMRPSAVRLACIFQLLTGCITALVSVTGISGYAYYEEVAKLLGQEASGTGFVLGRLTGIGMNLLFAFLFYQGINWGRILYLSLFFVNMVSYAISINALGLSVALGTDHPAVAVTNLLQIAFSFVTCILLTGRPAREWFSAVKAKRQDEKRERMR